MLCAAGHWEPVYVLEFSTISCSFLEEPESPGCNASSLQARKPPRSRSQWSWSGRGRSRKAKPSLPPRLTTEASTSSGHWSGPHLGTQAAHCPSLRHTCGSVLPLNDSGSKDNDKPRPVFQRKGDLPEYRGGPHGVVL